MLTVVFGAAAQAANTSSEVLVDTDGDGDGDAREFGGRDRYDTALRVANRVATAKGGLDAVPTVFIASGHNMSDALSVSSLAGLLDVPVLLTPSGSLHRGVANFIQEYGIGNVYVLGGSEAVADSVLQELELLPNEPTVDRIHGADRYATAVAIATRLGVSAAWCGGDAAAALLVNGGDVSLVEAMMVSPIAYRLKLPVLLTTAEELPKVTADFITSADIEHLVIVGDTGSVSRDVEGRLLDAGVDSVDRIEAGTAAATATALIDRIVNDCGDELAPLAVDMAALVHLDALPDALVSTPLLAGSFRADGRLVPMLLVGDTLPASVRDYLAATPQEDHSGAKINFQLVAIGGTEAVSDSVMQEALAAAASGGDLTVAITSASGDLDGDGDLTNDLPQATDTQFILRFNDDVLPTEATLESLLRDILEVNGAFASLGSPPAVQLSQGANAGCDPDHVTVTLSHPLNAGDTISVLAGAMLGRPPDQRVLRPTSVTVPAPASDRSRPTVDVVMLATRSRAEVRITDNGEPLVGALLDTQHIEVTSGNPNQGVASIATDTGTIVFNQPLAVGDRVTVGSGAVQDAAGNRSARRTFVAAAPRQSPRITSVLISDVKHSNHASTTVPDGIAGADDDITISANAEGTAAGVAGNGWQFTFDVASGWTADGDQDIAVWVNSRDSLVYVRFNDGAATWGDLKAALEDDSAFSSMFEVKLPADIDGGCGAVLNRELDLDNADRNVPADAMAGGASKIAIEVHFNGYLSLAFHEQLLDDVLVYAALRSGQSDEASVRQRLGLGAGNPSSFSSPSRVVRYDAVTSDALALPHERDLVLTEAGGTSNPPVAAGYAADDPTTPDIEENYNAASQLRIARSTTIKPPS